MDEAMTHEAGWRERWAGCVQGEDDLVRFVEDVGLCTINIVPRWPALPRRLWLRPPSG